MSKGKRCFGSSQRSIWKINFCWCYTGNSKKITSVNYSQDSPSCLILARTNRDVVDVCFFSTDIFYTNYNSTFLTKSRGNEELNYSYTEGILVGLIIPPAHPFIFSTLRASKNVISSKVEEISRRGHQRAGNS